MTTGKAVPSASPSDPAGDPIVIRSKKVKERQPDASSQAGDGVISILGPGVSVVGDLETPGSIRVEGSVTGSIRARKAVVVGRDGVVDGEIDTADAIIAGSVVGTLKVSSRLELQASARVEGTIRAASIKVEEGATLNGDLGMADTSSFEPEPIP